MPTSPHVPYEESRQRWRRTRDHLDQHRPALTRLAVRSLPMASQVEGTPFLARPSWIAVSPVPLERVHLHWIDEAPPVPIRGVEPELDRIRPREDDGTVIASYSAAMGRLARPALFENRECYRLVRFEPSGTEPVLHFGHGRYFDAIDTCEAAAHEFAAAWLDHGADGSPPTSATPFRSALGDPTDLGRRPVTTAISTLTIRHDRQTGDAEFLLHWRDPAKVASGGGLHQVIPVGMFQPSHDAPWNRLNDFDLWRSIMRELSEEVLGSSEDYGSDLAPIEYDAWPFSAALGSARASGALSVFWLGVGMDPLTFVTDMLTVAVFDADLFDELFPHLATTNDEGRLIQVDDGTGRSVGVPFRADHIERLSSRGEMQPAGAALLRLAWHHRAEILRTS